MLSIIGYGYTRPGHLLFTILNTGIIPPPPRHGVGTSQTGTCPESVRHENGIAAWLSLLLVAHIIIRVPEGCCSGGGDEETRGKLIRV